MLKLLNVFVLLFFCSCKDNLVVESRVEVKAVPIETQDSDQMTKEFLKTQFTIIESEETLQAAKKVKYASKFNAALSNEPPSSQ